MTVTPPWCHAHQAGLLCTLAVTGSARSKGPDKQAPGPWTPPWWASPSTSLGGSCTAAGPGPDTAPALHACRKALSLAALLTRSLGARAADADLARALSRSMGSAQGTELPAHHQ